MGADLKILIVGTADTKADELQFLRRCIERQGAGAAIMDVGVLGTPPFAPEYPNTRVAQAAGTSLEAIAALGDENEAMRKMAQGAASLLRSLHRAAEVQGMLAIGGTMGTDLALDLAAALPLGVPKLIVSTVAYSHLVPAERLAPDLMMILWAGGLYGLNGVCRSILSQAAGAVVGACRGVEPAESKRPRVAISSLGKSCLSYMAPLDAQLRQRGFEPVVFHATGMGGRAMESLIDQGAFVAVFDFALQELANLFAGSVVNAGPHRLEAAGRRGIQQLVAPGASDMVDLQAWAPVPARYEGRAYHAHNRLLGSTVSSAEERRALARFIAAKLNRATGPTAFLLPREGIHAWDRPGESLHDPEGQAAFMDEFRRSLKPPVQLFDIDAHINDPRFVSEALAIFDRWIAESLIPNPGRP
ncbi:MAG: Tm-1-like ATP-binding domain-containing protein [Gammaproteobacteria bacterium]|nr:Tm-1-like ATP-binding domain-containing protein [Gammaproteobacteria bacterium]